MSPATFLARVGRRLRLVWLVATAAWVAPGVALVALGLVALGWLRPWAWPERAALGVALVAVVAVVGAAAVRRLPVELAARAADRGLATRDAFASHLEFAGLGDPWGPRIRDRAEGIARSADPRVALPLPGPSSRWAVAALAALAAVGLGVLDSPQDDVRSRRARERAAVAEVADDVAERADELAADPATAELGRELDRLVEELRRSGDLADATEALRRAQEELDATTPADVAARQAATRGLDRSLEAQSLGAGLAGGAAEQLQAAAAGLAALDPAGRQALAGRLADLAETQAVGAPATAEALAAAGAALQAGDAPAAAAALGQAAAAHEAARTAVSAHQAAAGASAALSDAARQLQGQGPGQGQGAGPGAGQGQGQGAGQGQGQGAGNGASGQVAGAQGGTGSGQGGTGTAGGNDQPGGPGSQEEGSATVVDPATLPGGDEVRPGSTPTGGDPGEVVGRADGDSTAGPARVPLGDLATDYADRATRSLERSPLPPSARQLVGAYFDALTGRTP